MGPFLCLKCWIRRLRSHWHLPLAASLFSFCIFVIVDCCLPASVLHICASVSSKHLLIWGLIHSRLIHIPQGLETSNLVIFLPCTLWYLCSHPLLICHKHKLTHTQTHTLKNKGNCTYCVVISPAKLSIFLHFWEPFNVCPCWASLLYF